MTNTIVESTGDAFLATIKAILNHHRDAVTLLNAIIPHIRKFDLDESEVEMLTKQAVELHTKAMEGQRRDCEQASEQIRIAVSGGAK